MHLFATANSDDVLVSKETENTMFFPRHLIDCARRNAQVDSARIAREALEAAEPYLSRSDDELWSLMFGPALPRAWLVSYDGGPCLTCHRPITIYGWLTDPFGAPWKVICPHCGDRYPKNDFAAYHRSGLNEQAVFDPARADRSLLFNADHPDPADPLCAFGVDDGRGFQTGDRLYRFIAYYLIRGPWKQGVYQGIQRLASAYVLTGEQRCAHKAAVLLDRVADLYPGFDYRTQSTVYDEKGGSPGYVSIWHDACLETYYMALSYDMIREAIEDDADLVRFLSHKAEECHLQNSKESAAAIRRNIENGILHEALHHLDKIHSNYPSTEVTQIALTAILGWPEHRQEVMSLLDQMVHGATLVDGLTGEKGLYGYASGTISYLAECLALFARLDPAFLKEMLRRQPKLAQSYRFHVDTWCLWRYYPNIGDSGGFPAQVTQYQGARPGFLAAPLLVPSMFTFFMQLYEATGDPVYVQMLHNLNGDRLDGLPHDLFAEDPHAFQRTTRAIIERHGAQPELPSVNKQEWCLAVHRSGRGDNARALWLDYDSGGNHGHSDAMNVGLFAHGLDLMGDFGYPPVQYGGHGTLQATWYWHPAAHNTVVIDGQRQAGGYAAVRGRTALWVDAPQCHAIRASAPEAGFGRYSFVGTEHERVGFYFALPGTIERVAIYAKPYGSTGAWQLQFKDDFARTELGPGWEVLEGQWQVNNGSVSGCGILLCTRRFAGEQRVEYTARAHQAEAAVLGLNLAADDRAAGSCLYFAFNWGPEGSSAVFLAGHVPVGKRPPVAPRCSTFHIECEFQNNVIRHAINGQTVQEYRNRDDTAQYERTLVMVDVSDRDSYVLDIFRVVGGHDHAKFQHTTFGRVTTSGLSLAPAADYGHEALLRGLRTDRNARPGWAAVWEIEDWLGILPQGAPMHVRHIDLTDEAEAGVAEGFVSTPTATDPFAETWIPFLMVRRRAESEPLASTFVSVIEPYRAQPVIAAARRLAVLAPDGRPYPEPTVAVEIMHADGTADLLLAADIENPLRLAPSFPSTHKMLQPDWGVRTESELCVVRRDHSGALRFLV